MQKTDGKQTVKGKFAPGNQIGKTFPKCVSGNPSGRPKLTRLTEALREQLAEEMPNAPEHTVAEAVARALIREAVSGNVQAIREVFDRAEGRSPINLGVSGDDGEPMQITFSFNNSNTRLIEDGE